MKKLLTLLTGLLLSVVPQLVQAQDTETAKGFFETYQVEIVLGLAVVVCFVALLVLIVCLYALRVFMKVNAPKGAETESSAWSSFMQKMTDVVPVEKEESILTDHTYDGIKELDNNLPPWWLYGFYFTILFGIGYVTYFHVLGGLSQAEAYEVEMVEAEEQVAAYLATLENNIDESNVEITTEQADLDAAKGLFIQNCTACHGQAGEGGVGPNFTDQYWLHGGDVKDIFKTIKYGVPAKGMISWQSQLTPKQMQQLASFIITLEGTNPPNGKEPQGELYEREVAAE